jgi:hypothetical protein
LELALVGHGLDERIDALLPNRPQSVTSGLNFTQNHRFEFAAGVVAGAVD